MHPSTPRILGISCVLASFIAILLVFTHLPLLPCKVFAANAGYTTSFCALIDEDNHMLFSRTSGTYDAKPSAWTWVALSLLLIGIPYASAKAISRYQEK